MRRVLLSSRLASCQISHAQLWYKWDNCKTAVQSSYIIKLIRNACSCSLIMFQCWLQLFFQLGSSSFSFFVRKLLVQRAALAQAYILISGVGVGVGEWGGGGGMGVGGGGCFICNWNIIISILPCIKLSTGDSHFVLCFVVLLCGVTSSLWINWALCWVVVCSLTAPSHYLNHCWLIISKV